MSQSERPRTPSTQSGEPVRIASVKRDQPLIVRFLGPISGMLIHWQGKTSEPCQGPERCPSATHRVRLQWQGYAAVQVWEQKNKVWRAAALEVTGMLEETLRGRELRGETWLVSRPGPKGKNAPVKGVYCEETDPQRLMPAFDLIPILSRVWPGRVLVMDIPNPAVPRLSLPAVADAAPQLPAEALPEPEAERMTPEEYEALRRQMKELGFVGGRREQAQEPDARRGGNTSRDPSRNGR